MKIHQITERNIVFTFEYPEWDLNLHLILGEHRDYLIDTGMGRENIDPILNFRRERQRNKELIIVNTHYHFDHIWGNYLFKDHLIIAHRDAPRMIEQDRDHAVKRYHEFWSDEIEKVLPHLLVSDELYFADDKILLFVASGHSIDGLSVLDEIDGVLNVGDNIGDTMEQLVPELECSTEEYRQALEKYQALNFRHLVSGHNILCDKSVLDRIRSLL